jgi:hypothetical protein
MLVFDPCSGMLMLRANYLMAWFDLHGVLTDYLFPVFMHTTFFASYNS